MITLKDALKAGKLNQFITEHPEVKGDEEVFSRAVQAMAQKSKVILATSRKGKPDD